MENPSITVPEADEETRPEWTAPELKKASVTEDTLNAGGAGSDNITIS